MTALTRPSFALACVLASALVANARTAHAQFDPWRLELHWTAPSAQCPDEPAVLARVEALLGHVATGGRGDVLVARAAVTRSDAGALTVALATEHAGDVHHRDLTGTDCGALADATALMLAILVDPAAATIHAPAPVVAPEPVAPVEPPTPVALAPVARLPAVTIAPERVIPPHRRRIQSTRPPRVRFVLRLDALADAGALPSLAAGGSFAIGVRIDRVHVMLGAEYFLPQRHLTGASPTSLGGDFELGAGTLSACYDIARNTAFGLEGCALAEAGALAGTGVNVDERIAGAGPWLALGPAVAGVWRPVAWLGIRAQLGALVPVFRPPYVYESGGAATPVHQAGPITGRGALGVEAYF